MKLLKAKIEKSFFIKGRGVIVELMHEENGIKKDTLLVSEKSGLIWKMQTRVLFDHTLDKQILFENEDVDYMLLKFENIQKKMKSVEEILEKENRNIFQYFIKAVDHDVKPEEGEILLIGYPE